MPNPNTIQPMDRPGVSKGKAIGGAAAAIALTTTALIAPWEGKRNDPYLDIVKVPTVCYGETRVQMRRYTDAECMAMLQKAVGQDFAPEVFKCVPMLRDRPYPAAAAISLSYNIGTRGFCKSTAARLFNAGDVAGGCQAMTRFNRAGGKVVKGLVNRRTAEYRLCMREL